MKFNIPLKDSEAEKLSPNMQLVFDVINKTGSKRQDIIKNVQKTDPSISTGYIDQMLKKLSEKKKIKKTKNKGEYMRI